MSAGLVLDGLARRFSPTAGVDGVSLEVAPGEVLALLGPSGSGKTTLLRLIAGFERPDRGRLLVDGSDVTALPPVARRFGMVFQHYALFPHLDVGQNVAFGLEAQGLAREELGERVARALALVDLAGYERRPIAKLSGGQQQRVALARALAPEPRVLLLDEPLSNLDPALRERTRRELADVIRRVGITTVLVTHEQDEAFDLGQRVAVLRDGRLEQVDPPRALYARPATPFVAGFVGRAATVPVTVTGRGSLSTVIEFEGVRWGVPHGCGTVAAAEGEALLVARPEALRLAMPGGDAVPATVVHARFVGPHALVLVRTASGHLLEARADDTPAPGAACAVALGEPSSGALHLFPRSA